MKKAILFFVILLAGKVLKAQQIPTGPNTISFTPKEMMPGMFGKAFTVASYNNNLDSSTKVAVIIYVLDSSGNNRQQTVQQLHKNFLFPANTFSHYPVTKQEVISKVGEALNVTISH